MKKKIAGAALIVLALSPIIAEKIQRNGWLGALASLGVAVLMTLTVLIGVWLIASDNKKGP
jgi:hypothetical protein